MRINNQPPVSSPDSATASIPRADKASSTSAPHIASSSVPAVSAQDYSVVPSFELQSLTAMLAEVPPVRQDVVSETIRRLEAGDLQSHSALMQTANAILGD
jgi:hypothetical protein